MHNLTRRLRPAGGPDPGSLVVALCSLLALPALAHAASEWREYAGGPLRAFFNPTESQITPANVAGLRVKWTFPTGAVITASPSVVALDLPGEGPTPVAVFPSWDHVIYAVRVRDGSEVWRFATPDRPGGTFPDAGSATIAEVDGSDRVFVPSEQTMYALDAVTGSELWHFDAGTGCVDPPGLCGQNGERNQIESSPLVADGLVFFGMDVDDKPGGKGGFYALDARDGRLVWFFDLESGMTCRPDPGDDIRRYDGYHSEAELGLPAGFFTTRAGCNHPRTPTGCGNVWSSAAWDAGRHRLFVASSNCDTDSNPASLPPSPPMPPFDEAVFALGSDGTPGWRWRAREVDNDDLAYGAVPNLFTIDPGDGTTREVVGVGNKDGSYVVIDRDGVNARTGVRWDDPDPSGLPYWRTQVVAGGAIGGVIATAAVDEASARVVFSTAPGNDIFSPQRPTVHALDTNDGSILWQNTGEANADASYAPTSAIAGLAFVGSVIGGRVRAYDLATGAKLASVLVSFTLASAPAVVDGTVLVGGGSGQQTEDGSTEDFTSRIPSNLTALCVSGTPACDGDQDGADFPEDCDDADPARSPAFGDIPDNDVDEDCDGLLASSHDRCLEGGSAPQDARELAAVRAEMELACPCGDYDGTHRRRRRDYRRCTRPLVLGALRAGTLRRRCRQVLRQATCGRPDAAVCCMTATARGRITCKAPAARRCTSTRHVTKTAVDGASHCADVDCGAFAATTTSTTTSTSTSTTTPTLPASWAAIHDAVLASSCGGCHGGAGGLGGLDACATGYAAVVNVPSTRLPTMDRVEPGSPATSFLMHKLDGTQGALDALCAGGSCGGPMPPSGGLLPAAARDALRAWITAGAVNDCP